MLRNPFGINCGQSSGHTRAARKHRSIAACGLALARDKILSISRLRGLTILPLTPEGVRHALDLCVEGSISRQSYFDRQLASIMRREKIPIILTENVKDFLSIDGITPINPFV